MTGTDQRRATSDVDMVTPVTTFDSAPTEQAPTLGDIVTRGALGTTEYRIWLIKGDLAIATSQTTGIPHRMPLSSLRFVRHVPGGLFGARVVDLTEETKTQIGSTATSSPHDTPDRTAISK